MTIRDLSGKRIVQPQSKTAKIGILAQRVLSPARLNKTFTRRCGRMHLPSSQKLIPAFAKKYSIERSDIEACQSCSTDAECWRKFSSLNDFFTRVRKDLPRVRKRCSAIVSPADAYVVYQDARDVQACFWVKGSQFTLARFFGATTPIPLDVRFHLFIFRLAPHHYHRFHVPVCGKIVAMKAMGSEFFSVDPNIVRSTIDVFTRNVRVVVQIEVGERMLYMGVVGATCVGSIRFSHPAVVRQFEKDTGLAECTDETLVQGYRPMKKIPVFINEELGMFEFGGSSIVLCVGEEFHSTIISKIIHQNTLENTETEVTVGESLLSE